MSSLKIVTFKNAIKCGNLYVKHGVSRPITTTKCEWSKKIFDDDDEKTRKAKQNISELKEKSIYAEYGQEQKGFIYDKKPFKYTCEEGKAYFWCSCGRSHKQPFCDGTHKDPHLKISLRPMRWDCKETKEYWFCNCKQTKNPPFCDGTHKEEWIQKFDSTIRDYNSPPIDPTLFKKKKK